MSPSREARTTKRVHWEDEASHHAHLRPRTPSPVWSDSSLPESSAPYTQPATNIALPRIPIHARIDAHRVLQLKPRSHASSSIMYDVALHPALATASSLGSPTWEPLPDDILREPATSPPLSYIEVLIPGLPWRPVQIVASRPQYGVNVAELLHTIYRYLRLPITAKELAFLPQPLQAQVNASFLSRCSLVSAGGNANSEKNAIARENERRKGPKRVDCLVGRTSFHGISRSSKEVHQWQLHLGMH